MPQSRSVLWVDANGFNTITRLRTGAGASALQSAMLAASNADFTLFWESAETANGAPAPTAAVYQASKPFAALQFVCADASLATLLLPAPQVGIFRADKETVDITNGLIVAIAAAATAAGGLVSGSASAATALVGGKLLPYRGAP